MLDFREVTEFFRDALWYIITIAIIVFILVFVIAIVPVAGNSMNPTLNDGDLTIVVRLSYLFTDANRGDIVNIKTDQRLRYVKRVIGIPGDNVKYLNGELYINNNIVDERYLNDDVVTYNFMFEDICSKEDCPDGVIPEGMYLVLGDNREDSLDSRSKEMGLISKKEIQGKVVFKVWPFDQLSKIK